MASSIGLPATAGMASAQEQTCHATIPWYLWMPVAAVTSATVGAHWDISWHRSIGRDTFWTPAHMAIYLCGILAGISCGYLILSTTFDKRSKLRAASVGMWGFRGPLGAFIAAWGGVAMLTSAPFDDWWHNAYGLDVKIISPPHSVLAAGIFSVVIGATMLALGFKNRASGRDRQRLEWIYLYLGGLTLVTSFTFVMEYSGRVIMHSSIYYRAFAITGPVFLVGLARPAGVRFAAVKISLIYMLYWEILNWVLPLFPAEPKLGPVYHAVTHFVPSNFPYLIVIPAVAVDWLLAQKSHWPVWKLGAACGTALCLLILAVQWPFAHFLMSPLSRNWFFHTNNFDYLTRTTSYAYRNLFRDVDGSVGRFWMGMGIALAISMLTSTLGLKWGIWNSRVKR
jgi:hypothetical protein